ncbi:MAG: site-specific integrase [Pelagibacteraceae bacterium]|jgi:integrase|nr:site-specific integrase [Pelagibacteraceae bacterium]|tara:strand:+ start:105 stop:1055 length:951 start_codon:yes stop_codon:yes gene_type:complete
MSYIRKMGKHWQCLVRVQHHPNLSKTFKHFNDAKRWGNETELKIRREDAGIAKIKFPSFRDISLRYLNEVSIHKKCHRDERYTINTFSREAWSEYPINKITPLIIGRYRDKQRETNKDNTINRKLDVVSTIYTTCKKEWGYPVINPVLSIRRPKMPEVRTRRLSDKEINLLLKGNRTSEMLRTIIALALETGMRQGEILRIHPEHIKGNTLFIPIAKTKPRTIPLTKRALEILKYAKLPFNIKQDPVTKGFKKLCRHYGIKNAKFHDLRKNSLTDFMKVKKLSVPETMLIAGHSDPRMLLRIYNNLKVEDVAKKLS